MVGATRKAAPPAVADGSSGAGRRASAVAGPLPDDSPRVSIVILTALGPTHLGECLESIRQQSYPADRVEVIVVDNGSAEDPTAEVRQAPAAGSCHPERHQHRVCRGQQPGRRSGDRRLRDFPERRHARASGLAARAGGHGAPARRGGRRELHPRLVRHDGGFRRRRAELPGQGVSARLRHAGRSSHPGGKAAAVCVRLRHAGRSCGARRRRRVGRGCVRVLRGRRARLATARAGPRGVAVTASDRLPQASRHVGTMA